MTNSIEDINKADNIAKFEYVASQLTDCKVFASDAKRLGNNLAQVSAAIMYEGKLQDIIQVQKLTSKQGKFYSVASFARKGLQVGAFLRDNPQAIVNIGKDNTPYNHDKIIEAIEGKIDTAISTIYQAILDYKKPIEAQEDAQEKAFKLGCEALGLDVKDARKQANKLGASFTADIVAAGMVELNKQAHEATTSNLIKVKQSISELSLAELVDVQEFIATLVNAQNSKIAA